MLDAGEELTLVGGGCRPGVDLMMMSPNCSGSVRRPSVSIGSCSDCLREAGGCPTWPAGASRFWLWMALATSLAVMLSDASCCGSSQARMLYSRSPRYVMSETPSIRKSSSVTLIVA